MLSRLLSLAAALLLACASTDAHAYARAPERVGLALGEHVQQWKSAHRDFAAASAPASEENAAPTVWCVWKIPLAEPECVSATPLHRYLYAYANPTVYVDPSGRRVVIDVPCGDGVSLCGPQDVSVAPYLNPANIPNDDQRAALVEAQSRSRILNLAPDDLMAEEPLVKSGLAHVESPYIVDAKAQAENQLQWTTNVSRQFGFEPDYVAYGTGTEAAGAAIFNSLPPVAAINGVRRVANAKNGWDVASGLAETGLAVLPMAAAVRSELRFAGASSRLSRFGGKPISASEVVIEGPRIGAADPVVVTEGASGEVAVKPIDSGEAVAAAPKSGPYGYLPDHPSVGPGKSFTQSQKRKFLAENERANDGMLRDDVTGEELVRAKQHQKGVRPPDNEAHIDHVDPRSKGGANSSANAHLRSRKNNLEKSDD